MTEPFSTLLVDDEAPARRTLRLLAQRDPAVRIVGECRSGTEALAAMRTLPVELVFLDINMPGLDGFGALAAAAGVCDPAVIVASAYTEHAVRAFDVKAIDYLVKPFADERFRVAVERAKAHLLLRRLARQMGEMLGGDPLARAPAATTATGTAAGAQRLERLERLVVKRGGKMWSLPVEEIRWIEAQDYYVEVHAEGQAHLLRLSLRELEDRLDPRLFVRIHRSTMVNVRHVKELEPLFHGEYLVRLHDGTPLKLSRSFKGHLDRLLGTGP